MGDPIAGYPGNLHKRIDALESALGRLYYDTKRLMAGTPVRCLDETLAEVEAALPSLAARRASTCSEASGHASPTGQRSPLATRRHEANDSHADA